MNLHSPIFDKIRIQPTVLKPCVYATKMPEQEVIDEVISKWKAEFGVPLSVVRAPDDGNNETRQARRALYYYLSALTGMSAAMIGTVVDRNPSTVRDGIKSETRRMQNEF